MKTRYVDKTDPALLSELIGLESGTTTAWNADELGAVLRHQLAAPLQFDLSRLDKRAAAKPATIADAQGLAFKSFNDLFQHPNPPLELLKKVKDFAKASPSHPDSSLPEDVAYVLYLAAIIVARMSCGKRISRFDDATLRQSIELTLAKPWLDESMRALLRRGIDALKAGK